MTSTIKQIANNVGANYCKMPDGTLIQWGTTTINANSNWTRCSFPERMANTSYYATACISQSASYPASFSVGGKNVAYVDINFQTSNSARTVEWCAIGKWK